MNCWCKEGYKCQWCKERAVADTTRWLLLVLLCAELQRLKDRPAMACVTCEEHNLELYDELQSVKRWAARDEREALAFNVWFAAWDEYKAEEWTVDGVLNPPEHVREEFEKWWIKNKARFFV